MAQASCLCLLIFLSSFPAFAQTSAPPPFKREIQPVARAIMAGDRLRITVEEEPGLSKTYSVAGDGTIDFGYIGRVPIADLTAAEAAQRLEQALTTSYFKQAHVTVNVAEFVEGAIIIEGAVNKPGSIPFKGDEILSLIEAISQCGGLAPDAAASQVRILRLKPGGGLERQIITVDVKAMYDKLDFSKDQFLRPKDMVIIPRMGGQAGTEYLVLGEVAQPGFHPYTEGLDVIRAITRCGGTTRLAKLDAARLLRAGKGGEYTAMQLDLSRLFGAGDISMNMAIKPGDMIFVPTAEQASRGQVFLLGEVARPGPLPLPMDQDVTLAKTILGVGGFGRFANENKVKIQRKAPDGSKKTLVVDVAKILKSGNFEDDVPLQNGDVIIVPEKTFSL